MLGLYQSSSPSREVNGGEDALDTLRSCSVQGTCAQKNKVTQYTWHPGQSAGTQSVPSCTVRPFKTVVLPKLSISDVDEPRICHTK